MFLRTSRRSRVSALAAVAAVAAAAATALAAPAQSVPVDTACPDAYPVASLTANQPVDGLTVSSGNTPDTFTGEVLGVLKDGIAPGLDMILVRLTSTEIDRVGIWAGMSGSPVYAADGRLIGAVSYGLAFGPSPVAGVTPAADMKALIESNAPPLVARKLADVRHVSLTSTMQNRLVSEGLATPNEATQGMSRLPLPVGISGTVSNARLKKVASIMGMSDVRLYRSAAAPQDPGDPNDIFAGSNLAASMSYGDFSAVGTGTTTMVCSNQVIGFGHPFNWTGDASLTLHSADAIYIQEDPVSAGFKVSNTNGPVGAINGDHLAGINGPLGLADIPFATHIQSNVTLAGTATTRTGDTYVSMQDFLPDATAFAELGNQDRVFDQVGPGSSLVTFTVTGTAGGQPFTLTRTNRFASPFDISFESIFEMADDVSAIINNKYTDVTVDSVHISTTISPENRSFTVGKVERKVGDHYVTLTRSSLVRVKAGTTLTLRVTLNSWRNKLEPKVVTLRLAVPNMRHGGFGELTVGRNSGFGEVIFAKGGVSPAAAGSNSFDGLLSQLASAPRNDELPARLDVFTRGGAHRHATTLKQVHDVVDGARSFQVRVTT